MITAAVLTKNEKDNIKRCLRSLARADEIIIVDDYSTDGTTETIRRLCFRNVTIYKRRLNNDFAAQRNFALGKANTDWVLFVDADERVTPTLKEEIAALPDKSDCQGYYLKRKDFFLGSWLRHGETGNVKLLRLARKSAGQWERPVHEVWRIDGAIGELTSPIEHYAHHSISEFVNSINSWTEIDCLALADEGKKFAYRRILANPAGKFLQNYFFRLGFLDGTAGLVMAFMMSLYSLIVRVKLYEAR